MKNQMIPKVKSVICNTVITNMSPDDLPDDFELAGNALDSMAVTNLILALEEYFGFVFEDEELSAEDFETIASLSTLVAQKVDSSNV